MNTTKQKKDCPLMELHPVDTKNQLADLGSQALTHPVFESLKSVLFGKIKFSDINDK
jgi:hypothetical protein